MKPATAVERAARRALEDAARANASAATRDETIRAALAAGETMRTVAAQAKISLARVHQIANRAA